MTAPGVRPAGLDDVAAIHALSCACFGVNGWAPHQLTPAPERHVVVAHDDGLPCAGYAVLAWAADEAELQAMAVHEAHRRRGLGAALLTACCQAAAAHGARNVYLEVRAGNVGAQRFYRRFGFTVCGRRRDYYHAPDEDAVLMQLAL